MHESRNGQSRDTDEEPGEFLAALKKGALIGAVLLVLIIPAMRMAKSPKPPEVAPPVATAPQQVPQTPPQAPPPPVAVAPEPPVAPPAAPPAPESAPAPAPAPVPALRLADFNGEEPSPDARHVADWVVHTRNNKRHPFVMVDKKDARVYMFSPAGKLVESAPVLLGSAVGDDSFPGIGDKPLSAIKPYEKTTPAGRFVAELGLNANREDVVWVDYDAAVSMHRIRPNSLKERRLERLASLTVDDNRISFGCINLPVSFYENVLSPAVRKQGAVIYVLPETRTPQQVFGSYDVKEALQQAASSRTGRMQPVGMRATR